VDTNQFIKEFSNLGTQFFTEYTRNVERYWRIVGGMATEPVTGTSSQTLQDRYMEFLRTEGTKASKALALATLNYYSTVLNTGIEAATRFMDQVVLAKTPQPAAQAKTPMPSLLFHGKHGESPTNGFLVTNNRDEFIQVRFELTEITSEDASTRFSAAAKFTPESCQLASRSQQMIQCSIPLTEQFQPGQTYRSQIRVVGYPEMTMPVSIAVDEAAEPSKQSRPKKK
jgi:hypothetical protein